MEWARLKELYQMAEERPAGERAAFLESACGGDQELRGEIESLLAAGDAAGTFLDSTPEMVWAARAAAMTGTTLGHYRLESLLGRGGMGLVYRATDTRLGRTVALKIVRPELASSPDARKRLWREAKAASALKHPNIVTVYDAGNDGGRDFLAMEFVEGETLAGRMAGGPMPFRDAVNCALQVAAALEAAHAAGILHRDLKPQNVIIEHSGVAKVVDFGLAKLDERAAAGQSQALETHAGAVIGTAAYMSPEQAEGRPADARSDIFSLGALLYEMLSGRRAFPGASPASTLAAVLRDDPPALDSPAWSAVSRCLQKDPASRFQTAGELRGALEAQPARQRRMSRKWWRYAAALAPALAIVALATPGLRLLNRRITRPPQPGRSLVQFTRDSGLTTEPALSRDGRMLAYASDRGGNHLEIWVQPVDGGTPRQLTSGAADQHEPCFSPDGNRVCYRSEQEGGAVWTIPLTGGAPRLLIRGGRRPRYSPDGRWIAYWTGIPGTGDPSAPGTSRVFVVPAAGGEPRQIEPGFAAARYPVWLPDAAHLLFAGARTADPSSSDWWVAGLDGEQPVATGARRVLQEDDAGGILSVPAEWAEGAGGILFSVKRDTLSNLWTLPISQRNWKISGKAVRVSMGSGFDDNPTTAAGRMAFAGRSSRWGIWSLQRGKLDPLTGGSAMRPSISERGDLLVALARPQSLVACDLESGNRRTLVKDKVSWLRLTPDGSRVFYTADEAENAGHPAVYSIPARGGAAVRHVDMVEKPWDVSPDGSRILTMTPSAPRGVLSIDLRSGRRSALLSHPSWNLYWAAYSADGRWVAFTAKTAPDQSHVYVAPLRDGPAVSPAQWIPLTGGASVNTAPRWSPDGRRVYFFSDRDGFRCIWYAPFENGRPGEPVPLRHFHTLRQSLNSIPVAELELAVSRDRVVFSLDEPAGNIWLVR